MLLSVSAGAYVLIFLVPWSQDMFLLDVSDTQKLMVGAISAAVGIVCVEVVARVLAARAAPGQLPTGD